MPKGKLGISVRTPILIDKFADNRPTAQLIKDLKDRGVSLAPGTITSGLTSVSDLFPPLYDKIVERSRTASFSRVDERRYYVYGDTEGTTNGSKTHPHRWWLWVLLTLETVIDVIDPSLSSKVPLTDFTDRVFTPFVDHDPPTRMRRLELSDSLSPSAGPLHGGTSFGSSSRIPA